MSKFELLHEHPAHDIRAVAEAQWTLSRDETATVWYALSNYKDTIDKQVKETQGKDLAGHGAGYYEELMFLHDLQTKIARLMFELRDNHAPAVLEDVDISTNPVRRWLDTD